MCLECLREQFLFVIMIDSNISMEEDTELRDLVVQTLENNGVLAKVRAELRASVFLALEEQESVMNPEPLLNKTVKQYLANSEGKLLFSLVREFLEYFGLDYTISVYDPETYIGKEYNYVGRNKLCEELGINSSEPLLGEILKNSINICNTTQKIETNDSRHNKTNDMSTSFANTTFEVPVPKMLHTESLSNDNDSSEKVESISEQSTNIPINVTITDKKKNVQTLHNDLLDESHEKEKNSLRESIIVFDKTDKDGINGKGNNIHSDKSPIKKSDTYEINHTIKETAPVTSDQIDMFNKEGPLINLDESIVSEMQQNQNVDVTKQNSINNKELHIMNNVQNKKQINLECNFGKTIYFEEIIVDEKRDNVGTVHKAESSSPLDKSGSIFDLPPLNGKKTNINDIKELMDVGLALAVDNVDTYEEDFVSSASGSFNEQSPSKELQELESSLQVHVKKEDAIQSTRSEDISEEIEETDEILSSTSCLQGVNISEKDEKISHFTTGITTNYSNEM